LGGVQTLTGGISAIVAGVLYESHGRSVAYGVTALVMALLVGAALVLVGRDWTQRPTALSEP
jgi:hypothetical protein